VFFFTTAHGGILLLKFRAHPLLGLGRPLVHAFMAQLAQRFNQLLFDRIGCLDRPIRIPGQIQDALKARPQFGMLAEGFEKLPFGCAELTARLVFHPHSIGGTGDICTFYSAKIFPPLTRFQLHPDGSSHEKHD
jgi:hypothetical protein